MHTILAAAALGVAALYYLLPLVRGVLGGNSSASPPPGELPPFLPAATPAAIKPVPLAPTIEDRLLALGVLLRHYQAIGLSPGQIDLLILPHFSPVITSEPQPKP